VEAVVRRGGDPVSVREQREHRRERLAQVPDLDVVVVACRGRVVDESVACRGLAEGAPACCSPEERSVFGLFGL